MNELQHDWTAPARAWWRTDARRTNAPAPCAARAGANEAKAEGSTRTAGGGGGKISNPNTAEIGGVRFFS